jgi:hypothetical protein
MKDIIQQRDREIAIVIYDAPLPPKYLKFSRKFLHFFFIIIPMLMGLILLAFFSWGFFNKIQDAPRPVMPDITNSHQNKISALQGELDTWKENYLALQNKLSETPNNTAQDDVYLMAIKRPYGMQNLSAQKKLNLDQFELLSEPGKTTLKFQIISNNPETKVTGHVLVFLLSEKGMMVYPSSANKSINSGVKFNQGESFSVSRLRPTNAEFQINPSSEQVRFLIYLFNREGDLLLAKETDNFKIGK